MAEEHPLPRKLWEHPNPTGTEMWKFKTSLERVTGKTFENYDALYDYSCTHRSDFWRHVLEYFPVVYGGTIPNPVVDESARMDSIPRWFKGVQMNFAQNILFSGDRKTGKPIIDAAKADDKIACTEVREGSFLEPIRHVSWKELRERVGRLSQAMKARGVKKGDRIALVASTSVDTLTVFLATATLGALFSSSSTDMGVKGILDRLTQIKPKYVFMDDVALYNGKKTDLRPKMKAVMAGMGGVKEFEGIVSQVRFAHSPADISSVPGAQTWATFISAAKSSALEFEPTDFSDPFLVVYSSGTTGQPKCIVHAIGGVVIMSFKESVLHHCLTPDSTQLQYTTTGWIMYMYSVSALLCGCRALIYDGSPFVPNITNFVKLVGQEKVTHLGISPRYLQTLQGNNVSPRKVTDLSHLVGVTSTGMVLSDQLFEWFYDEGFPPSVHLDNISGGTDIAACFGIGNPLLPVYVGGCQCFSLGVPVKVYDQTVEGGKGVKGVEVEIGVPGELVADKAFPTMPVTFLGENGPQRYFDSYFARFDNVWTHGDFIVIHPITKQVMFLGRADGVLNPSGVRFGSAEIYSIMEAKFADRITDSICVGQRRPQDHDERVVLFLLMKPGHQLTPQLVREVKDAIRKATSPRHVPKFVFETKEIPTTVNLKKVELPVKQIVSGKVIKPSGTLLNPQSLDFYYQFAKDENLIDLAEQKAKL
ncbi:acetoacetate-CoA ligase [Rhinocladiella mackenziei CBS 650.93]|uniref:Acetoacetate-CoA ligase n=1 Tax=Rhinocladiella mackenziei CBS 650.93 TaxID=1442369 RepID=A0A0D2ISW9_9EURO|nr:acetoacetate-CoA ligase [Rhinocladiella mackenziei CBS 650.93]KIX09084.1 acetoacetate-CoA ligase [Rhinocladiella mackenziei CBS 650.93]